MSLDGTPLSNVQVEFVPETRRKPKVALPMSVGVTDEAGRYELHATDGRLGAAVGEHRVIVKDSERVVTDQQWKDRAGGVSVYDAAPKISFSFNNQSGVALQGRQGQTKRTADGYSFEIIVSKMQEKIAEDIHNGSSAVSAAFEQHYALQRRPGG